MFFLHCISSFSYSSLIPFFQMYLFLIAKLYNLNLGMQYFIFIFVHHLSQICRNSGIVANFIKIYYFNNILQCQNFSFLQLSSNEVFFVLFRAKIKFSPFTLTIISLQAGNFVLLFP